MALNLGLLQLGSRRVQVRMLASVGEYVAGHVYKLPPDIADAWIVRGYCEGELSQEYAPDELVALRGNQQVVSV